MNPAALAVVVAVLTPCFSPQDGQGGRAGQAAAFLADLAAKSAKAGKENANVVRGKDGWLFFAGELRSLGVGRFWGAAAAKVSRAPNPAHADPLPALLDFKAQLDRAGIELLVVPVPAKAAIYPEKVSEVVSAPPTERMDRHHEAFFALLRSKGVNVLDLAPPFLRQRGAASSDAQDALYCRQDTHWSGQAIVLAARQIAEAVKDRPWLQTLPRKTFATEQRRVTITGDLWEGLEDASVSKETLSLTFVGTPGVQGALAAYVEPSRKSPVLLLGDSHCLVFHAGGDMLAYGAGLPDHLARELGFPVDLVAVRGSGATPARINLLRRGDNLRGKRLVIWCFSVREFTEADGWRTVNVIKPAMAKPAPQGRRPGFSAGRGGQR